MAHAQGFVGLTRAASWGRYPPGPQGLRPSLFWSPDVVPPTSPLPSTRPLRLAQHPAPCFSPPTPSCLGPSPTEEGLLPTSELCAQMGCGMELLPASLGQRDGGGAGRRGRCAHLGHLPYHVAGHAQALHKGSSSHEGAGGAQAQLARGFPEGPQRVGLLAQAVQVVVGEEQLWVQLPEEALQQAGPELCQRVLQVQVGAAVVEPQLGVQVPEGPGALRVQLAQGAGEGILQRPLRLVQQVLEVIWAPGSGCEASQGLLAPCPFPKTQRSRIPGGGGLCPASPILWENQSPGCGGRKGPGCPRTLRPPPSSMARGAKACLGVPPGPQGLQLGLQLTF